MTQAWQGRVTRCAPRRIVMAAAVAAAMTVGYSTVSAEGQLGSEPRVGAPEQGATAQVRVLTRRDGSRVGLSVTDVESQEISGAVDEGAYVDGVRPAGPAAAAGFEVGDIVVEFDGERVRSARQLSRLVEETPAGRSVTAIVVRDGTRVSLDVTPEERPGVMASRAERLQDRLDLNRLRQDGPPERWLFDFDLDESNPAYRLRGNRLGIEGVALGSQLANYFGVEHGVLVASVEEGSVAARAGLRAGDVITAIDDDGLDDVRTLRRYLTTLEPGDAFSLDVVRDGGEIILDGRLEDAQRRRRRQPV